MMVADYLNSSREVSMRLLRSVPFLSMLVVFGCSDPPPVLDGGSTTDASAGDASAGDASSDDASSDDASVDAAIADASPLDGSAGDASRPDGGGMRSGLVSLTQATFGGTTSHVLFGGFARLPIDELRLGLIAAGCAIEGTSGPCIRATCAAGGTIPADLAGELRASVGGASVATATAGANGFYTFVGTGPVFAGGSMVTIEVTGGVVPAFSADVIAPGSFTATLPSTIARSAPLTVTWPAPSAEHVQLGINTTTGIGIRCIVPAEDGTLTVDASLLDGLTAGSTVTLAASAFNTREITVGDYTIDVSVAHGVGVSATIE